MTDRPAHVLAVDLGTSACKVALATTAAEVPALESEEVPLHLLPGGGAEQDPSDWWRAIVTGTRRLLADGPAPEEIAAVSVTAQWSGTVPVDASGTPIGRAIIWMDSRGAPLVRRITRGPVPVAGYGAGKLWRWVRKTGGIPAHSGKDSIAHILYLRHEQPERYGAAHMFLEPKDYLNLRLTGRFAASHDSMALHWVTDNRDPSRVRYDPALLRLSGLDRRRLPEMRPATDVLGPVLPEVAAELGLAEGTPVVMGTPDLQSAALGSGAVRDYEAHLYLGTSSWLTCHVPFKKTSLLRNMASLPSAVPGRYFVANEQETAGACLTFLRDLLWPRGEGDRTGGGPSYGDMDRMAEGVPAGSEGVIFTPWLYGERTPVEDRLLRGGFHNLSLSTRPEHLVRAVLEGVALNARWLLGAVERFVKRRLDPIRVIGGGAGSDVWCRIMADVLGRTLEQVEDPLSANVRGAAILAAAALGHASVEEAAARVRVAGVFEPDPSNTRLYDRLFDEFVGLYRRNRRAFARLNRDRPESGP